MPESGLLYPFTLEQLKQPIAELGSSKLKLFKMIDLAFDIEELEHIMVQFLEKVRHVVQGKDYRQSIILHQIYEYVNEHYANEISLSEMANALHLNYTYLSSYFKQRTQENLTSYINRVRTDKAKDLLLDPSLSVSEISRLTGFSDHNYFSKVFKKMTGMTPSNTAIKSLIKEKVRCLPCFEKTASSLRCSF